MSSDDSEDVQGEAAKPLLMADPSKTGELALPLPERRSAAELLEHGPLTVYAVPREEARSSRNAKPQDASGAESITRTTERETHGDWIEIPYAPRLPADAREIWHYTDAAGLVGIVGSGKFRAASLSTMNDSAEYQHGRQILGQLLSQVDESANIHPLQKTYIHEIVELSDEVAKRSGLFALCASESQNSLAQWRAYGGTHPHALVIDAHVPFAVISPISANFGVDTVIPGWRRVLYDTDSQVDLLLRAIGYVAVSAPTGIEAKSNSEHDRSVAAALIAALAYCKEPSFAEEREVRLLFQAPNDQALLFRPGRIGVTPYIELTRAANEGVRVLSEAVDLPIRGVVIGPFETRNDSAQGVVPLMRAMGYRDAWIKISTSTLR